MFLLKETSKDPLPGLVKKASPPLWAPYRSQNSCKHRHKLHNLHMRGYKSINCMHLRQQGLALVFLKQTNLQSTSTPGFLRLEGCP